MEMFMNDCVVQRTYHGPIKAVILDWSGTTVDAYVVAPAVVFVEVFRKRDIEITMQEAREPMGLRKDLHIRALTEMPTIRDRWQRVHGSLPDQNDIDRMFEDFVRMQIDCLRFYAKLLPGVAEVTRRLQKSGIKIGSTTGFTRAMVDILEEEAASQGYCPDASVAGDEVVHGARPAPFMLYRNLDLLDIHPIHSVVKVDDTVSGIGEAINAGCWGVGVARYSNYMGVDTPKEGEALATDEIERRVAMTRDILTRAGAHYVIDSVADIEPVIAEINDRLRRGEKP